MRDASVLALQAITYFCALSIPFFYRRRIGLGVFICALGVLHFLETYLASVFFIRLSVGLITPGSTVLFTGKLAMFLLLYVKEDAETVRQPIYGLLAGNIMVIILALLLRLYGDVAVLPGYNPDFRFVDQMGLLMIWGTLLLFVDIILLIIIYERLQRWIAETIAGRFFVSLAIVLTFDQIFFFVGLHLLSGVPFSALLAGLIAKLAMAALYSLLIAVYLTVAEPETAAPSNLRISDVFDRLTYRHRYENLLQNVGRDGLTGLSNRSQLDIVGREMITAAQRRGVSLSLMMIDVDRFKEVNDTHGHAAGDAALRDVSQIIASQKRDHDTAFRYGGDEFAILCAGDDQAAVRLAERIRTAFASVSDVTLSIGVASFPNHATDLSTLLDRADKALYAAKRGGRDQICVA